MSTKKVTRKKTTKKIITPPSDNEEEEEQEQQSTVNSTAYNVVTSITDNVVADWTKDSEFESVGENNVNIITTPVSSPSPPTEESNNSTSVEKKSVIDFDRTEVAAYENMTVSDMSNDQLLMILIRRGEEQKNPVISGGCERLLRQINRESINPHRGNRNNHFRGKNNYNNKNHPNYEQDPPSRSPQRSKGYPPTQPNVPYFADPNLPEDPPQRVDRRGRRGPGQGQGQGQGRQFRERTFRAEYEKQNYVRAPRFDN